MVADPVDELRASLRVALQERDSSAILRDDEVLHDSVRWRPHLYDEASSMAWHCLAEHLDTTSWAARMLKVRDTLDGINLGVCIPEPLIYKEDVIETLNAMNAAVALVGGAGNSVSFFPTVADVIYENRLLLPKATAARVLDKLLDRCHENPDNQRKGVSLEILTAVLLSQIDGFEVTHKGVSNRSQQMDVMVHNRRTDSILGGSPIVVAEAKNWSNPVGTHEYWSVHRKIQTRFGRSKLGFFVTTDRFTAGNRDERLRDSSGDILIVPLDKETLPRLWRDSGTITGNLERAAIDAATL